MDGAGGGVAARARRVAIVLAALVACVGPVSAQSLDEIAVARLFGAGVHAYFSGDYVRSHADLTAVVEAGCQDPRAFYFRGLSALRLGMCGDAEADFAAGASLESDPLANWPVSQALERVQGAERIALERHRARARVAALQLDQAAEQKRYSGIALAQPDVLRKRRPAPRAPLAGGADNVFEGLHGAEPPVAPEPGPETPAPGTGAADPGPDAAQPGDGGIPATDTPTPDANADPAGETADGNATDLEPEMESQPGGLPPVDTGLPPDETGAPVAEEPGFGEPGAAEPEAETPMPDPGDAAGDGAGTMPEEPATDPVDAPAADTGEADGDEAPATGDAPAAEAGADAGESP